jgi:GNAT superfamily N-acetyltransferase
VTDDASLIRLELANQIAGSRAFLTGPTLSERYGTSFDTVAGLACSTCAAWGYPLFNRVIGAGVLAPLDEPVLEAILAHYAGKGQTPNVEVYDGITPPSVLALLASAGFTSAGHGIESHALETDHAIAPRPIPATVRKIGPDEYARFGELVRDGFDMHQDAKLGPFFVDLTVASLRSLGEASVAFVASVDGKDAGTGQLVLSERVAGCYSGSVLEAFRGRGIQHALIAARVAEGLRHGRRIFISQTDPDSPSGHNLHDVGFRTLYRATWLTRPA